MVPEGPRRVRAHDDHREPAMGAFVRDDEKEIAVDIDKVFAIFRA
jgi:hypothetical protein